MKIETRTKTLREVTCEATYDEGNNVTSYVTAYVGEDDIYKGVHLNVTAPSYMTRERWEDFKKLGDAAWEAWDKTFGDKQPETMGVYKNESGYHDSGRPRDACGCNKKFLDAEDYRDHLPCPEINFGGSFVWFPGDHDFKGSAQRALNALKAEKPEWKLELREYKKPEAKTTSK